jgi:hypothetical protein
MIAPRAAAAPTQPGRCDQQSLADGRPRGPQRAGRTRAPRADPGIPRPYAAAQLRALEHDELTPARAENTQAATRAKTALPSRASRATTAPIHGKRRYGSPRSARSRRSNSPRTRAALGANRRFSLLAAVGARPRGARLPCRPTASARRHRPPHAYNLPKGGRGPFFVAPRARPRVPGAVSEWVSFGKPSSPAIRNRAPNRKPSTRARSVLFGKWVAGAARAQQTSPWTARSSSSSVGCV